MASTLIELSKKIILKHLYDRTIQRGDDAQY